MYKLLSLVSRQRKQFLLVVSDFIACLLAFLCVDLLSPVPLGAASTVLAFTLLTGVLGSLITGTNRIVLRTLSVSDLKWFFAHALILLFGFTLASFLLTGSAPFEKALTFGLCFGMLAIVLRVGVRSVVDAVRRRDVAHTRVVIYGAGLAGQQLNAALRASDDARPMAFFDDNPSIQGSLIGGLRVHAPTQLKSFVQRNRIEKILVAVPSISEERRAALRERLKLANVPVLELPPYDELITRKNLLRALRPISTNELLNRDAINIDMNELDATFAGKNVLVSGAGGSIGSELCRQIMQANPKSVILLEICEFALYSIDMELRKHRSAFRTKIVPLLNPVCNQKRLARILKEHDVDIVLHAAAYKHVPLAEENPIEAGRNNILDTHMLAAEAAEYGVERFIFVSTDKAVRPTNVMGATKRLAELVIQDLQSRSQSTRFSIVRFGNVLSSSGSVIPLFKKQIEEGGPITVTDPNVARYFMTISEAASLVLLAGSFAEGGEVFALDMGKLIKLDDLAKKLVLLAGLTVKNASNPDGDIEIIYTGLRPGEKMYEELFESTKFLATPNPKILRADEAKRSEIEVAGALRRVRQAIDDLDTERFLSTLEEMVEGFGQRSEAPAPMHPSMRDDLA